jgi:hypothetical protein
MIKKVSEPETEILEIGLKSGYRFLVGESHVSDPSIEVSSIEEYFLEDDDPNLSGEDASLSPEFPISMSEQAYFKVIYSDDSSVFLCSDDLEFVRMIDLCPEN